MLKMIHCADIHLGSKMQRLPKEKANERKDEVRATFTRMVEYAKENGVRAVLIAGDAFDSDRPFKKDKNRFYDIVRKYPEIDFLYLRGNHDGEESYEEEGLDNLKRFGDSWTSYEYEGVCISGVELKAHNATSIYASLALDERKINIVTLHGQIENGSSGVDKVNLVKLKGKNIDYLALGHIHSYSNEKLDERGRYGYSGCLEGRGFDETGEKGFVLLEIDAGVKSTFVPFAWREIVETEVDISDATDEYTAIETVRKTARFTSKNLYRVRLVGDISFEADRLAEGIENECKRECYFLSVKDQTRKKIDFSAYEKEVSLRGEFIRVILRDESLSEEEKNEAILLGLKALRGEEVE